jgi:O-acetylserine/cysteine efflux transporter
LPLRDLLLACCVPVLWGVGFAIAKPASAHFPPLLMLSFCYLTMTVLLGWRRRANRTPRWQVLVIAALIGPVQGGLLFHGLQGLPASVAVLLVQMQVPMALLVAWPLLGERPRAAALLGTAIALGGIVLILGAPKEPPDAFSAAMVLVAGACWGLSQVLIRRWSRDSGPQMSARVACFAFPLGVTASFLVEDGQLEAIRSAGITEWSAITCVALLGYVTAYLIWYGLLTRLRMDRVMPFVLLMPVVTVSIGVFAFGEPFAWSTLAGGLVVLGGLALVVVRRAPAPLPAA